VSGIVWPAGFQLDRLSRRHPRGTFTSGQGIVDDWLATKALQNQEKHLSTTKVLVFNKDIAGYYTLVSGQVDFSDLPPDIVKKLPKRMLPVAVLAWLGVSIHHQGQGLGKRLLAHTLYDCFSVSQTFAFVGIILDCIDENAKSFYQHFDFEELPGHPYKLFLSAAKLDAMMRV
jgi:GNAT superfamily N-acetyltransferase